MLFIPSAPLVYAWTPYDANVPDLAVSFINGAKRNLYLIAYNFSLQPIIDALEAAEARGVKIRLILDHTQECGPSEKTKVEAMLARVTSGDILIGTSPIAGQIIHRKFLGSDLPESQAEADAVIVPTFTQMEELLDWDGPLSWSGSWNMSQSGVRQLNDVNVIASGAIGYQNYLHFMEQAAWLTEHEARYQPQMPPAQP